MSGTHADEMDEWRGRIDAVDGEAGRRWHQVVQPAQAARRPASPCWALPAMSASRNHGRSAPRRARGPCANTSPTWRGTERHGARLYDAGDVRAADEAWKRHRRLRTAGRGPCCVQGTA